MFDVILKPVLPKTEKPHGTHREGENQAASRQCDGIEIRSSLVL
jgi:hypothetical protein